MNNKLRFCFTSYFLVLSSAVILLAILVVLVNWWAIGDDVLDLYRLQTLPVLWVMILLVTLSHEFAHGLTCKRFGGEVHELGFMLLYFQPAFYCNVSDAWLFPEKTKRLGVTFAGAYFEIFLWALATITWRMTEPGTAINYMALVVMITSGIKALFNLNPLIKLDGYYLLSDYLEIPNLRMHAFRYLGTRMKRLWGAVPQDDQSPTPRECRIYVTYGLLATTYSFALLGFLAFKFSGILISRYQGLGALLFIGLLLIVFRKPLKKVFATLSAGLEVGHKIPAPMRRLIKILLVLAVVLVVLFFAHMELRISGEFTISPIHSADIRAQVPGIITEIYVDEGYVVHKGSQIARLSDREYQAERQKIEDEISEKQAHLKMLKIGPRQEEIELHRKAVETGNTRRAFAGRQYAEAKQIHAKRLVMVQAGVEKAYERLKYARSALDMSAALLQKKLISQRQFEEAEELVAVRTKELAEKEAEVRMVVADDLAETRRAVAVAEKEVGEAQSRLSVILAGSRPEEIEATEATLARLQTQLRYQEEQLHLVQVLSPIAGVVTTPHVQQKLGQYLQKGDLIAQVHDLNTVRAAISIAEKEVADVEIGQRIILKARAFPWHTFYGEVSAIAPIATRDDTGYEGRTILVSTQLVNDGLRLKSEMTGKAKILCGDRRIIELLMRRLALTLRIEFWSWW